MFVPRCVVLILMLTFLIGAILAQPNCLAFLIIWKAENTFYIAHLMLHVEVINLGRAVLLRGSKLVTTPVIRAALFP